MIPVLQVSNDPLVTGKLRSALQRSQTIANDLLGISTANTSSSTTTTTSSSSSSGAEPLAVPILLSGAGHDAMAMAEFTKTTMAFVRCRGGISHNPLEYTSPNDVALAAVGFATFMEMDVLDAKDYPTEDFEPVEKVWVPFKPAMDARLEGSLQPAKEESLKDEL